MAFKTKIKRYTEKDFINKKLPFYVMISPFLLFFIIFMVIPMLSSVFLSFTNFNMVQIPKFIGLDNYIRLFFEDDVFIKALQNTLIFAIVTGPVGFIMSFIVAWFVNELGKATRSFVTLIMYAPSLTSNVYLIWLFIFSGDAKGFLNSQLMRIGIIQNPIPWLADSKYNFTIVMIVVIWQSLGAGFLALVAGLKTLDRTYYEAAAIDGIHNRWQELYYVTLPQMGSQLMFSAVMSISASFAVGYQSQSLTGFPSTNYSTHTLLLHMIDYGTIRLEMGYASSIAVVLFAIMLGTWFLINRILKKFTDN